jgi:hypothetical protein
MTAYPGQTRTMLGQLCTALWDSLSRPDVIQPGFEPGAVVTPLALRCSALNLPSFTGYHNHCVPYQSVNFGTTYYVWGVALLLDLKSRLSRPMKSAPRCKPYLPKMISVTVVFDQSWHLLLTMLRSFLTLC